MSHMLLFRACWRQAKEERKMIFWKEIMHKEIDNYKEEQHVSMQGRDNDIRVRVLVMYCKG
jgi:hypothetical protein